MIRQQSDCIGNIPPIQTVWGTPLPLSVGRGQTLDQMNGRFILINKTIQGKEPITFLDYYLPPQLFAEHLRQWLTSERFPAITTTSLFLKLPHNSTREYRLLLCVEERYRKCFYPIIMDRHCGIWYPTAQAVYLEMEETVHLETDNGRHFLVIESSISPRYNERHEMIYRPPVGPDARPPRRYDLEILFSVAQP